MNNEAPPLRSQYPLVARRTVLAGAGATLLTVGAGCTSVFGASRGATDVFVENKTSSTKNVTVGVYAADGGHELIKKTVNIPPGQHRRPTLHQKIPWDADYKVTVSVEDGQSETYLWKDIHDALYISLSEDGLSFETRKHPPSSWTTSTETT